MFRKIFPWVMQMAGSSRAMPVLFFVSFIEASVLPVSPYALLVPMVLATPARGLVIAFWCTTGTVLGGVLGYLIGYWAWEWIGYPLVLAYGGEEHYHHLRGLFDQYDAWIILIGGITPVPFKIFTITAGAMKVPFLTFMVSSILGRSLRFFLVALALMWGGDPLRIWMERHCIKVVVGGMLFLGVAFWAGIKFII